MYSKTVYGQLFFLIQKLKVHRYKLLIPEFHEEISSRSIMKQMP